MCGRIKGYQLWSTDAFEAYHNGDVTTIDGAYVSGVSLTHGRHPQLVFLRFSLLVMMLVLAILPLILPSHNSWVETICSWSFRDVHYLE